MNLTVDRKASRLRPHEPRQTRLIQCLCKGVETTISPITEHFLKSIHAVTAQGFTLKSCCLSSPMPSLNLGPRGRDLG